MVTIHIRFPLDVVPDVPHNARPVGSQPRWAPKEWEVECDRREEADLLVMRMNCLGATAKIMEDQWN